MAWYNSGTWHGGIVPMQDLKILLNELRVATSERSVALGRGAVLTWPAYGPVGSFQGDPSSVSAWVGSLRARLELLITPSPGDTKRFIRYATGEPFANVTELLAAAGYTNGWVAFLRPQTCVQALYQIRACLEQLKWFNVDCTFENVAVKHKSYVVNDTYPTYAAPIDQQANWEACLALPWPTTWTGVFGSGDLGPPRHITFTRRQNVMWEHSNHNGTTRVSQCRIAFWAPTNVPSLRCSLALTESNIPASLTWPYNYIVHPYNENESSGYGSFRVDQAPMVITGNVGADEYSCAAPLDAEVGFDLLCNGINQNYPQNYFGTMRWLYYAYVTQTLPATQPFGDLWLEYPLSRMVTAQRSLSIRYTNTGYRFGSALGELTALTYG